MALPVITPNSIATLSLLGNEKKPVFRITLSGHPQTPMIIKGEVENQDPAQHVSMLWTSKLMRNNGLAANRQVVVNSLTLPEIAEFKKKVKQRYATGSNAVYHIDQNHAWVKMPEVVQVSDLDFDSNSPTAAIKIKRAICAFLKDGIWKQMGQVVSADLFNGNNDRFDYFGNWNNKGNIMFTNNELIGLDTWSSPDFHTSAATNDTKYDGLYGPSNLVQQGGFEALTILIDSQRQLAYAQKVTQSVGKELAKYAQKVGMHGSILLKLHGGNIARINLEENLPTMFLSGADEFAQGLQLGSDALKTYLQAKIKQYKTHNGTLNAHRFRTQRGPQAGPAPTGTAKTIPQGILDRMEYLGWLPKVGW